MRIACRVALVVAVGALLVSCTATVQEDESIGSEEASGTTARQQLIEVWEDHMAGEFATKSVEDTMATMIEHGSRRDRGFLRHALHSPHPAGHGDRPRIAHGRR
jgi:hypothetical protein